MGRGVEIHFSRIMATYRNRMEKRKKKEYFLSIYTPSTVLYAFAYIRDSFNCPFNPVKQI